MTSLLPNMRLLGLPSTLGGQDFDELSRQIDSSRDSLGYDLAEESIFLFYSDFPGDCKVARSVTGPLKPVAPFELWDWVSRPVQVLPLIGNSWARLHEELGGLDSKNICVRLSRKVGDGRLFLSCEALLHD